MIKYIFSVSAETLVGGRMKFSPLYSGSSGNSYLIEAGNVRILMDAGMPGRALADALREICVAPESVSAIVITHDHSDHVSGAGIYSRKYKIPVYANSGTWEYMAPQIGGIAPVNTRIFETGKEFYIGDVAVLSFATPHDAAEPVGYCFFHGGQKISAMTDIGHMNGMLMDAVEHSGLLLIEANHDVDMLLAGSYPYPLKRRILSEKGHLSNEDAGKTLSKLYNRGVKRAVLGHLSQENNYEPLCMETVRSVLRGQDIPDSEFELHMAHRNRPSGTLEVV